MWRPPSNGVILIICGGTLLIFNFIQTAGESTAPLTADVSEKSEKDATEMDTTTMRSSTVDAANMVDTTVATNKNETAVNQQLNRRLGIQQVWSSVRPETTPNRNHTIFLQTGMNRTYTLPRGFQRTGHRRTFYEHCMDHRNSFADLATLVLYSLVCLVGLFGNTLVIYVVLRFSKMQTVTNIYILNLAIADECFLIGIPFLLYTMRICSWRFGDFMCKAYMVSTSITQFTSSIFLLIMSADRYLAVCHPIASPKYRTQRIAKIVSAIAWLTSAVLMLPVILYASTVIQEDGVNLSCNIEWPETYKKHSATTFTLYTFFLGFATPLFFILCFYYLVIRKLHAVGSKHKSKEKKRSHRKVTRLVLTVITVYILCWLPYWISQVTLINSNPMQNQLSRLEILIFLLLFCLVYSNSAMNPILYAFLSDNFRKSFFKAFSCMTKNEVNAQLQAEASLLTKPGNGKRRQKRQEHAKLNEPNLVAATSANNNSSVTTSSTTTAPVGADKVTPVLLTTTTVSTDGSTPAAQQPNGRPSVRSDAYEGEDMILVLEHERPLCTLVEQESIVGSVLQTDL